jgi:AcrR family transcriptional regulator
MSEDVKPRRYRSTLRADQARQTRRRIREAADALFRERGYVAVSMGDIAEAAGVARQTVFTTFGSKAKLLKEALDVRLVGDDEPLAMDERPEGLAVVQATDAVEAIRRQASLIVDVALRIAPLWPAAVAAAAEDPEMAEIMRTYERARHGGIGTVVDVVARLGALRRDRSRARAKDAVWLLTSPATAADAAAMGWSAADLRRWYVDCLSALLLDPDRTGG